MFRQYSVETEAPLVDGSTSSTDSEEEEEVRNLVVDPQIPMLKIFISEEMRFS